MKFCRFKFLVWGRISARRSCSDFCDLLLRCPSRTPVSLAISETLHCDLRVRWKVASDLRFRVAMSEPETLSFCGISGDLALSTRKSLAIATVRFWCAKVRRIINYCAAVACKRLTLLVLGTNRMTGKLPTWLSLMPNFWSISLDRNFFSGLQ